MPPEPDATPTTAAEEELRSPSPVVVLRLFAAAREAAGTGRVEVAGSSVGAVLAAANERYGERFAAVVAASRVWVDGQPAASESTLSGGEEVAVLPPVSGGAGR